MSDFVESDHDHDFAGETWPFSVPVNSVAFCQKSIRNGHAILTVVHDHDGDWQFLHGDIAEGEEPAILCLGCVFQMDPSISDVADIPPGSRATREMPGADWELEEYDESEEEEE